MNRIQVDHGSFDGWVDGYKVRYFPWVDGESYFFDVQYRSPGMSVEQPPLWEKSMLVKAWDGRYVNSIVHHIANNPQL
jgi:hypothetical protein